MAEIVESLSQQVSLGIIQTHVTQFDGPFLRFLARDPRFDFTYSSERNRFHLPSRGDYRAGRGAKTNCEKDRLRKFMSNNAKNLINGKWHYRSTAENL
jgi:hypothetical protein